MIHNTTKIIVYLDQDFVLIYHSLKTKKLESLFISNISVRKSS